MMIKKTGFIYILLSTVLLFISCTERDDRLQTSKDTVVSSPRYDYHIALVSLSGAQSADNIAGVETLIRQYGKAEDGGLIQHTILPDNFIDQRRAVISLIEESVDDPLVKALVVYQAVPGTAEAFTRIRDKRPDVLLLAGEPHEDPLVIQAAADLVLGTDYIARAYHLVHTARELGAKNFVHISFPRHLDYPGTGHRRQIMQAAAEESGLRFVDIEAPDPTGPEGIEGSRYFITENTASWVQKYGKETAFFTTNDAHAEPLIRQLLIHGGIFVEPDLPSPSIGYPEALYMDISEDKGNYQLITDRIEELIVLRGASGRFGTWTASHAEIVSAGLAEYAKQVIEEKAEDESITTLMNALGVYAQGTRMALSYYTDPRSGAKARNHIQYYLDTYIFGKGFMITTDQKIPDSYYRMPFIQ